MSAWKRDIHIYVLYVVGFLDGDGLRCRQEKEMQGSCPAHKMCVCGGGKRGIRG